MAEKCGCILNDGGDLQGGRIVFCPLHAAAGEMLEMLKIIIALDDGDKPDLWHFEAEFAMARYIIAKTQPEGAPR